MTLSEARILAEKAWLRSDPINLVMPSELREEVAKIILKAIMQDRRAKKCRCR